MTLYDEWVRTATALEKYKKELEDSKKALQAEKQQAQVERQQAESEKHLMEHLLNQNRIDDLKRALKDPNYKEKLLEELTK